MVTPVFSNGVSFPEGKVITVLHDYIGQTLHIGRGCKINLETEIGDQISLKIFNHPESSQIKVHDVNGLLILNNRVIFSVSPVYGEPGIYQYSCGSADHPSIIVPPVSKTAEYPGGKDYFMLKGYNDVHRTVEYYYAGDVDKVDFQRFPADLSIKVVTLP